MTCWVRDLDARLAAEENDRQRNEVTRDKARMVIEFDFAAPRARLVWDYFTSPELAAEMARADEVREEPTAGRPPRRRHHQSLHAWRARHRRGGPRLAPFDYLTLTTLLPMPDAPKILMTYAFTEQRGRRHPGRNPPRQAEAQGRGFFDQVVGNFREHITHEVDVLKGILASEQAGASDEPPLPDTLGRSNAQAGA